MVQSTLVHPHLGVTPASIKMRVVGLTKSLALCSGCFRSARTSSAVAIIYVIFLVLVGPLLVELIPNVWPPVLQLIPLNGYVYRCVS